MRLGSRPSASALGKHGITVNAYAPGGIETRLRQSPLSSHVKCILMDAIDGQSTYLMTSWSRSQAHARDATGSVLLLQAIHFP